MPAELLPEAQTCKEPDRILILVDPEAGLSPDVLAAQALFTAVSVMPKVTGYMVSTLRAIHDDTFFGIYFPDRRVWFQEQGIRPFTMHHVAGKVIPMWIEDPTGAERKANPKAKTRQTMDGRTQVLIFRKAAEKGARKTVRRKLPGDGVRTVSVPASYPGAPGRIARREASAPSTTAGRTGGRVARGNVGVRWRHPGIVGRHFLNYAMTTTAWDAGLDPDQIYLADSVTLFTLLRRLGAA
jgi:hypothetical protein